MADETSLGICLHESDRIMVTVFIMKIKKLVLPRKLKKLGVAVGIKQVSPPSAIVHSEGTWVGKRVLFPSTLGSFSSSQGRRGVRLTGRGCIQDGTSFPCL